MIIPGGSLFIPPELYKPYNTHAFGAFTYFKYYISTNERNKKSMIPNKVCFEDNKFHETFY